MEAKLLHASVGGRTMIHAFGGLLVCHKIQLDAKAADYPLEYVHQCGLGRMSECAGYIPPSRTYLILLYALHMEQLG